jgi:hypothetical protein
MDASWSCLSPCTEIGIKMRRLHPAHRESPLQVYRNDPKGRRIDTPCGAYPALFPNMPTPEREWPRADSEIAAGAFVVLAAERPVCPLLGVKRTFGKAVAMSANDPKRTSADIGGSRFLRDITGFGGTKSQAAVINITPTPSETMWQAVFTPVGTFSVFGVQDSDSLSVWHRANGISGLPL